MTYYDDEGNGGEYPAPPPSAPPAPPILGGGPSGGPSNPPQGPVGPTGGGGGGGFVLPPYPNFHGLGGAPPAFNPTMFHAPSMQDVAGDAGYQLRLGSANNALEHSAAAQGHLRTGGTLNDIQEQSQNFAANEYQQAYQRALAAHQLNYNAQHDMYAPGFEQWRLGAQGQQQAMLAGYGGQIQNQLQQSAPHGGGGNDPLMDLLPFLLGGGDGPPVYGGGQYQQMGSGDPWTELY